MKKLRCIFLFSLLLIFSAASQAQTCCQPTAAIPTMFSRPDFMREHLAPLPLKYEPRNGQYLEFTTAGPNGRAYLLTSPNPSRGTLLIFHEWWGVNDYMKREAEARQNKLGNVRVFVVDLFDGKVAKTPEEAQKIVGETTPERCMEIIQGAIKILPSKKKIATLGWCYGGGWALQASLAAGNRTAATVMYYGLPELDQAKLKALHGPVIEFFGSQDKFIDQAKKIEFEKAMTLAHKHLETKTYSDAGHGFANPSNPIYNKAAAADANKRALAFLKRYLK